jgi:cytochrome c oxidase assembly protein subunit 15
MRRPPSRVLSRGSTIGGVPTTLLRRIAPSPAVSRFFAVLLVVLQCLIAVTGSVVRISGSGLGCPTWPRCTTDSLVPVHHPDLDPIRIWVEFGNRMLSVSVGVVSGIVLVLALLSIRRRRRVTWLAASMPLGVVAQAVIGGITVLTHLQWYTVCLHFLVTPLLVWLAVLHLRALSEGDEPARPLVPKPLRALVFTQAVVLMFALITGTLVTAAGPHSGGLNVPRLTVPIPALAQLHADLVVLMLGMIIALGFGLRAAHAGPRIWRHFSVLVVLVLAQGVLGGVQYALKVPDLMVIFHVAGATLVIAASAALWTSTRERGLPPRATDRADDTETAPTTEDAVSQSH